MRIISDIAFDAVDEDGNEGLDEEELHKLMSEVSLKMGVTPPSKDDLKAILNELDDDFDGVIDKCEFNNLAMIVIGKMLE